MGRARGLAGRRGGRGVVGLEKYGLGKLLTSRDGNVQRAADAGSSCRRQSASG